MSDLPEGGDYIVGWKLRIIVRIDEFGDVTKVRNLASNPITPPQTIRGVTSTRSQALFTQTATGYAVGFQGATAATAGGPQAPDSSSDGLTYTIGAVIPKSAKWSVNGFKEPDTMACELRYTDVPFDPMCFRSVAVELYVGTMTQDDYTAGVAGGVRQVVSGQTPTTEPLNVIPDGFVGPLGEQRSNLRFQGFVDEWEIDFSDENLAMVRFKCSDNTRLLIDQPMPPGLRLDTSKPIDAAIAQLLSQFPQFAGLTVEYRPAINPVPSLGKSFSAASVMPDGLQATQGGAAQTLSVWDFLVEMAIAFGHNIRVEGTIVVIQRIRAALGKNFPPRQDDPFKGRTWGGTQHHLRTFIWGRNCKQVHRGRKYARTGMNIECLTGDSHVDARDVERLYRRAYTGPLVRAYAEGSRSLAGSPNHPMLTTRGLIPLEELEEGDYLVCCALPQRVRLADPHVDGGPATIEEVFASFQETGNTERIPSREVDFHGDGMDAEVEVVVADRLLRDGAESAYAEHVCEFVLEATHLAKRLLDGASASERGSLALVASKDATTERSTNLLTDRDACLRRDNTKTSLLEKPTDLDPLLAEAVNHDPLMHSCFLCESAKRSAPAITLSKVLRVERDESFSGHVFNLQTRSGFYTSSGAMSHNCRSYNPLTKSTMIARYPPFANTKGIGGQASGPNASTNRLVHALPGDGKQETKYTVYPVPGVADQATLNNIAQAYFEGINRAELAVTIHTKDLASFGGDENDPDILDIFAGDRFEYLTERYDDSTPDYPTSGLGELENVLLQVSKAHDVLTSAGFNPGFVKAYCAAYTSTGFQTTFVVKRMDVSMSIEDDAGIEITIEGVNMVEARVDAPGVADGSDAALGAMGTAPATGQNQPVGGP